MSAVIRIHPADDVAIARRQLLGGTRVDSEGITVAGLVPPGHKIAVRPIAAGAPVRRYNQIIGFATQAIAPGQHVHTHNLAFSTFERSHEVGAGVHPTAYVDEPATFMGIVRDDGRVATRNYIGVLTSVNCSATAARAIADQFRRDIHPEMLADYPNVDGVVALTHGAGCATASDGEELLVLRRTLGGYARHANFAAVLVVGLGCETNQIQGLMAQEGLAEGARLLIGGKREGRVLWPTILTDTRPDMKVMCEEAFAPLVSIVTYRDFDEALRLLADSPYGLQAGIYTQDIRKAFAAIRKVDVGGMMVNDTSIFRVDHMPYGGNKMSGIGREGVRFAIEEMTNIRMVCFNLA